METQETTGTLSPKNLTDLQLVDLYVKIRDKRAQRKAEYENNDASDKEKQNKIEAILLSRFQDAGHDSVKTAAGTAYRKTTSYSSVSDWDTFFTFCKENEAWELISHAAAKAAIQEYRERNNDLPPGISWREEYTIGVRRS